MERILARYNVRVRKVQHTPCLQHRHTYPPLSSSTLPTIELYSNCRHNLGAAAKHIGRGITNMRG
jgi:hypothetical protein